MKVIRTTTVTAREGNEEAVVELMKQLDEYLASVPGIIDRYEVREGRTIGRVTIWTSRELADRAANMVHVMSLRAQILGLCEEERLDALMPVRSEKHS